MKKLTTIALSNN